MSILSDPFPSLLALRRRVAPPKPDLLQESHERGEAAHRAYDCEIALRTPHSLPAGGYRLVYEGQLPDPYGPDPVVFGSVPRVGAT